MKTDPAIKSVRIDHEGTLSAFAEKVAKEVIVMLREQEADDIRMTMPDDPSEAFMMRLFTLFTSGDVGELFADHNIVVDVGCEADAERETPNAFRFRYNKERVLH